MHTNSNELRVSLDIDLKANTKLLLQDLKGIFDKLKVWYKLFFKNLILSKSSNLLVDLKK